MLFAQNCPQATFLWRPRMEAWLTELRSNDVWLTELRSNDVLLLHDLGQRWGPCAVWPLTDEGKYQLSMGLRKAKACLQIFN